jgi:arylsulfatase
MLKLDNIVGELTQTVKDLGIEENTIVIFGTDKGAELVFWPDGGMTHFRGEKATTWEGGFRAPCLVKWPGKIKPGQVSNAIFSGEDWLPTFLSAAGEPDVKEKLLKGHSANGKDFKVHLDGYNQLPFLIGESTAGARDEIFYFDDDGSLNAFRYKRWKIHFKIQENHGFDVWQKKNTELRFPMLMDLKTDPFERAEHDSEDYRHWMADRMYMLVPAQVKIAEFLATFKDYPQRQALGSFSLDQVLEQMQSAKRN